MRTDHWPDAFWRCNLPDATCASLLQAAYEMTAAQLQARSSEAVELTQQVQQLAQVRDALQQEADSLSARLDAVEASAEAAAAAAQQELAAGQVLCLTNGIPTEYCDERCVKIFQSRAIVCSHGLIGMTSGAGVCEAAAGGCTGSGGPSPGRGAAQHRGPHSRSGRRQGVDHRCAAGTRCHGPPPDMRLHSTSSFCSKRTVDWHWSQHQA